MAGSLGRLEESSHFAQGFVSLGSSPGQLASEIRPDVSTET